MEIIALSFVLVTMYIWYQTEAVPEYASLLRLKWLKYKEFFETQGRLRFDYWQFMQGYQFGRFGRFIVHLFACPECFSVWLNVIAFTLFKCNFLYLGLSILATWWLYPVAVALYHKAHGWMDD